MLLPSGLGKSHTIAEGYGTTEQYAADAARAAAKRHHTSPPRSEEVEYDDD